MCRVWGYAHSGMCGSPSLSRTALTYPSWGGRLSSKLCPWFVGVFRSASRIHSLALYLLFHPAVTPELCPAPLPGASVSNSWDKVSVSCHHHTDSPACPMSHTVLHEHSSFRSCHQPQTWLQGLGSELQGWAWSQISDASHVSPSIPFASETYTWPQKNTRPAPLVNADPSSSSHMVRHGSSTRLA